jgi:hypothetical protein
MYPDPQGQWLHVSDAGVKEWLQDALLDAAPPGVDVERLAEVLRRHDCDNSTPTACAQGIAAEYARLGEPDD